MKRVFKHIQASKFCFFMHMSSPHKGKILLLWRDTTLTKKSFIRTPINFIDIVSVMHISFFLSGLVNLTFSRCFIVINNLLISANNCNSWDTFFLLYLTTYFKMPLFLHNDGFWKVPWKITPHPKRAPAFPVLKLSARAGPMPRPRSSCLWWTTKALPKTE